MILCFYWQEVETLKEKHKIIDEKRGQTLNCELYNNENNYCIKSLSVL